MGWAMVAGAGISVIGGMIGGSRAKKQEKRARRERERIAREMQQFEQNRQEIINPYENVTSNAPMIEEMRNDLSNPFANLGVATQAAEIQMEQTDIALANTLDTLQATGASAGGATALAQAAKQSKKEVAANLEQQEAQNEKLRAQGEQDLQAKEMQLTQMEMAEVARIQGAEAAGAQFVFGAQETRDMAMLDRMSGMQSQAAQNAANARMESAAIMGSVIQGVSGMAAAKIGQSGTTDTNKVLTQPSTGKGDYGTNYTEQELRQIGGGLN
jgi:ribosomal protein S8E